MSKNILLLFTGGLDSTYLLYKNLKDGNKVTCLYTNIQNNGRKSEYEFDNANKIIEVFKIQFKTSITLYKNSIECNLFGDNLILKQVPIHLFSLAMSSNKDFEEVQVGYCMNDDMMSYLSDFKKIYYSYQSFNETKLSKLTFPLKRIHKLEMVRTLKAETDIINYIFSCEAPSIKNIPCGHCHPCIRYEALDNEYNCLNGTNLKRVSAHELKEKEYFNSLELKEETKTFQLTSNETDELFKTDINIQNKFVNVVYPDNEPKEFINHETNCN